MSKEASKLLERVKNPLSFYALALILLESVIAVAATVKFSNEEQLFNLYMILLAIFVLVILLVTYITIRYPKNLLGQFEKITEAIISNLSTHNRKILFELDSKGLINYTLDDKDNYKDLRNSGLVRTRSRQAMRKDNTILLTELGVAIVNELKRKKA